MAIPPLRFRSVRLCYKNARSVTSGQEGTSVVKIELRTVRPAARNKLIQEELPATPGTQIYGKAGLVGVTRSTRFSSTKAALLGKKLEVKQRMGYSLTKGEKEFLVVFIKQKRKTNSQYYDKSLTYEKIRSLSRVIVKEDSLERDVSSQRELDDLIAKDCEALDRMTSAFSRMEKEVEDHRVEVRRIIENLDASNPHLTPRKFLPT